MKVMDVDDFKVTDVNDFEETGYYAKISASRSTRLIAIHNCNLCVRHANALTDVHTLESHCSTPIEWCKKDLNRSTRNALQYISTKSYVMP